VPGGGLSLALEMSVLKRLLFEGDHTLAREFLIGKINSVPQKDKKIELLTFHPFC
jgi:hypothetical protein